MEKVKHSGGCHCGQVRFEVWAPKDISVWNCKYASLHELHIFNHAWDILVSSCSICHMKGTQFFVVSDNDFKIVKVCESFGMVVIVSLVGKLLSLS